MIGTFRKLGGDERTNERIVWREGVLITSRCPWLSV